MINLRKLKIGYDQPVLYVENLKLEKGKIYALVGKNGSGKSSLLKTLCRLNKPLEGNFELNGISIFDMKEDLLSKTISFVGSNSPSLPYITLENFVLLGRTPYVSSIGRFGDADKSIARKNIALFGLTGLNSRELSNLSDGERQLGCFARAFTQETPIIIMDEPTAFLDYGNKKKLITTLRENASKLDKCVLFSTHDIDLCLDERLTIFGIDPNTKTLLDLGQDASKASLFKRIFTD